MAVPPSYQEAVSRPDWLVLAAPYVATADFASLCLVNRRCWSIFAPRLWRHLPVAVRRAGLDPGHDVEWWFDFAFEKLARLSTATRALVRVLDARHFAKHVHDFSSYPHERQLERSFTAALELLPNADCLLLDSHLDLNPALLFSSLRRAHGLRLLSISDCPHRLPRTFFASPCLQSLVFLDASGIPGSLLPLVQTGVLPQLRVLKLRRREMDDAALTALVTTFSPRLWSLDVSDNRITDAVVDTLRERCMYSSSLRSGAHFDVEGEVVSLPHHTAEHGRFLSIAESRWSATFSHPERYFVDAPAYVCHVRDVARPFRFNGDGAVPIRRDSAEAAVMTQAGPGPEPEDDTRAPLGLTHLHVSRNQLSSFGMQKLLRHSSGQLEELDCDSMPLLPRRSPGLGFWPASIRLYGILGAAHLFRPVMSSNLRKLRIHHSLVTHVPTLEADGLSALSRLYLAETSILERVLDLYPQAFEPDMNPRLSHLTLTCVPRRSWGPLTARLTGFLQLLASQEAAMREASSSPTWRGPMLQGLRHLTLEFEPDPMEDGRCQDGMVAEECNKQGFSFFPDEERLQPPSRVQRWHSTNRDKVSDDVDELWNAPSFAASVWVGSSPWGDYYHRLVVDQGLRHGIGPVTPCQVRAGVPEKSYVFHTAYCASVMPSELRTPTSRRLAGMKDVVAELRSFRGAGGGGDGRWGGDLTVVFPPQSS
ncbi:hypothetical protein XA68_10259 [Ophiocordyceps unilateralis]|uniref:Uncharacterized protein n=1 Tax=Ophiocordyceps unilateralis TaxID=268505 RepID=A0A2A9NZE0_OPHUN|nr:hypothetical protein XA68_10259 [Ophiocordyceps unilateralis]